MGNERTPSKLPYFSDCVGWPDKLLPALNLLIDDGDEIGRDEFLAHADANPEDVPEWDWHIQYFRYGEGLYYYVHSAIEYVFTDPGTAQAVQDRAEYAGY